MNFPRISKQERREVNLPELKGGVNFRDSVSDVSDNHLTDALNMYFSGGQLKTRPNLSSDKNKVRIIGYGKNQKITNLFWKEIFNSEKAVLQTSKIESDVVIDDENKKQTVIKFAFINNTVQTTLPSITEISDTPITFFCAQKFNTIYCFLSTRKIYQIDYTSSTEWTQVSDIDMFIPKVYIHCTPSGDDNASFEGTQFYSYSLITPYYKMIYSSVKRTGGSSQKLKYKLAENIPSSFNGKIKAEFISATDGTKYTHELTYTGTTSYETTSPGDGLYMCATESFIIFSSSQGSTTPATKGESDYLDDNLTLIVPKALSDDKKDKVFAMTQCMWYGGASEGIYGGTRLFLCGNTKETEKALLIWSDRDEPLFFGEKDNDYVDNQSSALTGFGKQSEYLILFKAKETFYSYYSQKQITADDLISQSVIGYEANAVYFPIFTVSNVIGCDCPKTIELCRNRLIWTSSSGRVWTLTNNSQYSERNIYDVSEMIYPKLKEFGAEKIKNASAIDLGGMYLILVENVIFALDYNSYGYQYVASYSKTDDANARMPWWIWRFDGFSDTSVTGGQGNLGIFGYDDYAVLVAFYNAPSINSISLVTYYLNIDDMTGYDEMLINEQSSAGINKSNLPITSFFQTKIFDFGAANYYKNVDRISLSLGNNGGIPITSKLITDFGSEEETFLIENENINPFGANYVTVKQIRPCIRSIIRAGIKIKCNGNLSVEKISIYFRLLGGAK